MAKYFDETSPQKLRLLTKCDEVIYSRKMITDNDFRDMSYIISISNENMIGNIFQNLKNTYTVKF